MTKAYFLSDEAKSKGELAVVILAVYVCIPTALLHTYLYLYKTLVHNVHSQLEYAVYLYGTASTKSM